MQVSLTTIKYKFQISKKLILNTLFRRSTTNSNIITRKLCRNRRIDDNELYRSNSFKFERFKRKDIAESSNTLPRPVSI